MNTFGVTLLLGSWIIASIKEMLAAKMRSSQERDNLLEKLVRQFVEGKPHKIMEFEPFMSDSMKKRFQFELDMEKFTGLCNFYDLGITR